MGDRDARTLTNKAMWVAYRAGLCHLPGLQGLDTTMADLAIEKPERTPAASWKAGGHLLLRPFSLYGTGVLSFQLSMFSGVVRLLLSVLRAIV